MTEASDQPPSVAPPVSTQNSRILLFIAGLSLGLAAQVLVIPIAIFLGLTASEMTGSTASFFGGRSDGLVVGLMVSICLVLEAILVAIAYALSLAVKRIQIVQGCLAGALIAFLLYSGCWGLLWTSM